MNKLRQSIKLVLFISVASLFFAACSDDDDKSIPVPEPSRMITGIKVHKISDVITYQGMISLTYDNNKRLTRIYSSSPLAAVNYTYKENSEVSYTYSTDICIHDDSIRKPSGQLLCGPVCQRFSAE